jgi:integral membrane protein
MVATPIGRLRLVGIVEGISYLVLLGVAMPLKYLAGMPLAVRWVGWAHGVLFVLFCLTLLGAMRAHRWSLARAAWVFVAGLVPFGTFAIDGRLRREEEEHARGARPV